MKLIKKCIDKDKSGFVVLCPEEAEDTWHCYNLIQVEDQIKTTTIRRVQSESATGSVSSERIRTTLTLTVKSIDYDTEAAVVRINGQNCVENKWVKLGAFHTLMLESHRHFTLSKTEWDTIALERIQMACDISQRAEIAAILMEEGLANVCLLTDSTTLLRQRIDLVIPKKRRGNTSQHEKALDRFYDQIYRAVMQHIRLQVVKVIILASPAFVKDQCFHYMMKTALSQENKALLEAKSKFVLTHCSSGHKHELNEILKSPVLATQLADTKYAQEVKTLQQFYTMMNSDMDRAIYGLKHIKKALDMGAIATLMLTDTLFRALDVSKRKFYIHLVEQVRAQGGKVLLFSSLHVSGEQLAQLTGVAAILTFPLADLSDDDEEEEAADQT